MASKFYLAEAHDFSGQGHIHLWDVDSGIELLRLTAAKERVQFVGFNVDGDRIIAWSARRLGAFDTHGDVGTMEIFKTFKDSDDLEAYARRVLPR